MHVVRDTTRTMRDTAKASHSADEVLMQAATSIFGKNRLTILGGKD